MSSVQWIPHLPRTGMPADGRAMSPVELRDHIIWRANEKMTDALPAFTAIIAAGLPGVNPPFPPEGKRLTSQEIAEYIQWRINVHKPKGVGVSIGGAFKGMGNIASSAGRSIGHAATSSITAATGVVGKIPLVGTPLAAGLNIATGPIQLGGHIMQGERIDRAFVHGIKDQVSAVRDLAPYVKLVVTQIPGIGSGVGAAFAMGEALADGRPIDAALVAGVKGAIPGGQLAGAAFDVGIAAAKGENLTKAGLSTALSQLPEGARKGVDILQRAAAGERLDKIALEQARAAIPADIRKGLDIGLAVGHGAKIQGAVTAGITTSGAMGTLGATGASFVAANPLFKAGAATVTGAQRAGYDVAAGLLSHSGVNEAAIYAVREKLEPSKRAGFDIAAALRVGRVRSRPPPHGLKPVAEAAFYATKGMQGGPPDRNAAAMRQLVTHPDAKAGIGAAFSQVANARTRAKLWRWLGAIVGAGAGAAMAGPFGLLSGGTTGYWLGGKVAA